MNPGRKATGPRQPSRRRSLRAVVAVVGLCCALIAIAGCRHSQQPRAFLGDPEPAEHVQQATQIKFPDVDDPGLPVEEFANEPRRLRNSRSDEVWDLSLAEAIHLALVNSRLIRSSATFMSAGNPVFSNPDSMPSTFDPAIQETGVLFGRRGVEAALSDFDAQFTSSMIWGKNASIQNNRFTSGGIDPGDTLVEETSQFSAGLQKRFATGAQIGVLHSWNYTSNNASQRLFPSAYDGMLRAEYRQPLLAGAGVDFTRIAGPISTSLQGVSGVQQGVIIARINNDIALADFEKGVHSLLHDVETLYWQLHLAYRGLDIEERLLAETAEAWNIVDGRTEVQGPGGGALENAEARDLCFETEARLLAARDALYSREAELRRLIGLPVNDGRIIRPIDEPVSAELLPDWNLSLCEALSRRPELRRQKWVVKSLELQRRAADNLTQARLDLVGGYQLNGFGDNLLGPNNGGMPGQNLGNAYDDLLKGDRDGWNVGVEFAVPVGKRFALAQVRNLELQTAKARTVLEDQEREISHEVAAAFRALDLKYLTARNAYNRWLTADDRHHAVLNQYQSDSRRMTIETVVRARDALGRAEQQYVQALIEYNAAILELHYRTGRLPEIDGVTLSEGPWDKAAYDDARHRWIERTYANDNDFLSTEPEELTGAETPGP
jgi:outer membrane protein TolC